MTMAAKAVLQTFELLETILLELPMLDLLISQRVSRTWRSTITTSKPLQKALFLLPATDHCAIYRDDVHASGTDRISRCCQWRVPDRNGTDYYFLCPANLVRRLLYRTELVEGDAEPPEDLGPFKETDVYLNPVLLSHFPWSRWLFSTVDGSTENSSSTTATDTDESRRIQTPQSADTNYPTNPHRYTSNDRVGMDRPQASWKRMLICQPPLGGLTITPCARVERDIVGGLYIKRLLSATDVRFAMLYGFNGQPITIERLRHFMDAYSTRTFVVKGKEKLLTWRNGGDLRRIQESIRDRVDQLGLDIAFDALDLREADRE